MTTASFSRLASAVAQAQSTVRALHCKPPAYRPAQTVRASIRCTKCGGNLNFTVSAGGHTSGRCSSLNCVTWSDL